MTTTPVALPKVCSACPSFLSADKTISKFKKSIGAPMCGRLGTVLGKPNLPDAQAHQLQTHIASKCPSFGMELPPVPTDFKFEVALPDLDARDRTPDPEKQQACKSCSSCVNYIRDDVVAQELGWSTGMCAAKGRLILTNRQVFEAKNCPFREYGPIRTSTFEVHLLPEYEDAFQLAVNPVKAYFSNRDKRVEPHEYPTDRPVAPEDTKRGIRAWRRIVDPAGSGNEAYLPIYEISFFDAEEQAKIPRSGDDEHPELYVDHFGGMYLLAVTWTELDETPALWGEAGVGKTELYRHASWLMCLPFERLSITRQTEVDDLIGKMLFEDGETTFHYGRLPRAWSKPCVICLDEPNVGPPEVFQAIRPLTDNSKQMVIDQNKGERRSRHDDCYFGLAMNPAWDPKNVGTEQMGDADASRLFHVFIELPPPELEREIIINRVRLDGWEIDKQRLDMVMAIAGDLRGLCDEGTLPVTWGIRPQIKVARALRWFDPVTAYRRAVGDYLEPEAQAVMLDTVRAHLPGGTAK